jgi:tetratricopeptide (TPR) repeat protein
MNWREYEKEVGEEFSRIYPKAQVELNIRRPGVKSGTPRQIDLLVTEVGEGYHSELFVDAKLYQGRVDIKEVESFISMLDDVGSDRGILVSNKGFTSGAMARVIQEENVDLDILNFDELDKFQGYCGIPYAGNNAAVITPPLGWVVDITQHGVGPTTLYPRGLNYKEAVLADSWMYLNFWHLDHPINTLEGLIEEQNERLKCGRKKVDIQVSYPRLRSDFRTALRIADVDVYPCLELTGYIDFKTYFMYAVMFCNRSLLRINRKKLEWFLQRCMPVTLKKDNSQLIAKIDERLKASPPETEKTNLLAEKGRWQRDMGNYHEALETLNTALKDNPSNYPAMKELLLVHYELKDKEASLDTMGKLLRLDPRNPQVFKDCLSLCSKGLELHDMVGLFDALKSETDDQVAQANCDFYAGQLLINANPDSARCRLLSAET